MKTLFSLCTVFILFILPIAVYPQTYQGIIDLSASLSNPEVKVETIDHATFIRMAKVSSNEILVETNTTKFFLEVKAKQLVIKSANGDSLGCIIRNRISYNGNTYRIKYPIGHDLRIRGTDFTISGHYSTSRRPRHQVNTLVIEHYASQDILSGIMLYKLAEKIAQDNDTSSYWLLSFVYALGVI